MTLRVVIAAGGTGGHFYPGLAVLESLAARRPIDPMFVGTARGIEARVVPQLGHKLTLLDISPLNGVRGVALFRALAKLPRAGWQCLRILRDFRPDLVVSVGGYAAGPIAASAVAMRVPLAIVEPNAIPGLTHRLVGRFAARAFTAYPEATRRLGSARAREFGNPVRAAFAARAREGFDHRTELPHVLVVGGSQGARSINRVVPEAVRIAQSRGVRFSITHQTGVHDLDDVREAYGRAGVSGAEAVAFIDDVATAMARADLVVCRSGAGTVSELGVIGRPALFIPLPGAADDHQRRNAESIAARGGGDWLAQKDLTPEALADRIVALLGDRPRLRRFADAARAMGHPDAADRIAEDLLELVDARSAQRLESRAPAS